MSTAFNNKKQRAFTLIELLVVIAIIGLLSSIVLVSLGGARSKARDATRQSDIRQVVTAQEMYYDDNSSFIQQAAQDGIPAIGIYLGAIDDPQTPTMHYKWLANNACTPSGQAFCAYATLENKGNCSTTKYFAVSEKGSKEICDTAPSNGCACW